ncbi:MAG: tRNA (adenosine(37)-N6)-dimethylallyltransferase MiaA [Verrucomicrobiota bacterium]|nr:tRNA (adenosine(37)-N6)-dimethylallyltransferase MiaA [Verrucomicrobiota bacterium]
MRPTLHFLAGPTASGKTALALAWAQEHGAAILSCDAYCVYRGMDIGTAKPTLEEQKRVPHYGIDICEPGTAFSVGAYAAYSTRIVEEVMATRQPLLITGGSGFYLKSFFAPVTDQVEIPEPIRQSVEALEASGGIAALLKRLDTLNPEGTGSLDRANPRRVVNALLRCEASGLALRTLTEQFKSLPLPFSAYEKRVCLLERTGDDLKSRVAQRTQQMLASGLIDEVRRLRAAGLENNPTAASAIGYRETLAHLAGAGDVQWLHDSIALHTLQLIKKQRTWFRHQIPVDEVLTLSPGNDAELQFGNE